MSKRNGTRKRPVLKDAPEKLSAAAATTDDGGGSSKHHALLSPNSVDEDALLDFNDILGGGRELIRIKTYDSSSDDDYEHETIRRYKDPPSKKLSSESKIIKADAFQPDPKMLAFTGFLRLANFVCASAVLFGVIVSLKLEGDKKAPNLRDLTKNMTVAQELTHQITQYFAGHVQMAYLVCICLVMMVDSVATISFRWKEYGEITHQQADATSILFVFAKSRWAWRLLSGLALCSAVSLEVMSYLVDPPKCQDGSKTNESSSLCQFSDSATKADINEEWCAEAGYLIHAKFWFMAICASALVSSVVGCILNMMFFAWHGVAWLYDGVSPDKIEDKGDLWIKTWGTQLSLNHQGRNDEKKEIGGLRSCAANILSNSNVLLVYLLSVTINIYGVMLIDIDDLQAYTTVAAFMALQLLNTGVILYSAHRFIWISALAQLPFPTRFFAFYSLTSSVRLFNALDSPTAHQERAIVSFIWTVLAVGSLVVTAICLSLTWDKRWNKAKAAVTFMRKNVREPGVNKKVIRCLDTIATILGLVGLVLGLNSIFVDQYDMDFEPRGNLTQVVSLICKAKIKKEELSTQMKIVTDALQDWKIDLNCEEGAALLVVGAGFLPFGSLFKSVNHVKRVENSLRKVFNKLTKASKVVVGVVGGIAKAGAIIAKNLKKIILTTNMGDLIRLLPLLPPVVLGLYVMFGAFWPKRQLFFSKSQRLQAVCGKLNTWILGILSLAISISVSTALIQEMVEFLNESLDGLVKVHVHYKLGWRFAMVAAGFSTASAILNCVTMLILRIQVDENHANITNEELDWKRELEKRELVSISGPAGSLLQKRTHLKYKKERLGPWNYVVPALLVTASVGFGFLANENTKFEMRLEPRGQIPKQVEKLTNYIEIYNRTRDSDIDDFEDDCLLKDMTSILDVLQESQAYKENPVRLFFKKVDDVLNDLGSSVTSMRKQIIGLDSDEDGGGGGQKAENTWQAKKLKYIGLILTAPRVICLLILVFGALTASVMVCQMTVIPAVEPKRIVGAFGKMATFSLVFVLGSQLALFNVLSSFGVPFYHIDIKFGLGFIYDLVADCIMMAVYIGMKNEYFFAIPRKRITVTYDLPGITTAPRPPPNAII